MTRNDIKKPIIKSISYRILGSLTTVLISLFLGLSINWSLLLGFGELIVKPILYFFHELIWEKWIIKDLNKDNTEKIF